MRSLLVPCSLGLLGLTVGLAHDARAQDAENKAQADSLFDEGKQLMTSGDFAKACSDFESSLKIYPQLGTKMNLADCYEKSGKIASAWAEFRESASFATKSGDPRTDFARKRVADLEPRVDKLVIHMAADQVPGVTITRDGRPVVPEILGKPVPVDPGQHQLVASAPGFADVTVLATVAGEGTTTTAEIPRLVPAGPSGPSVQPSRPLPLVGAETSHPGSARKTAGIVLVVAGGAALATSAILGVAAKGAWDDSKSNCTTDTVCGPTGKKDVDRAFTDAHLADAAIGIGLAFAVGGAILWATAPKHHASLSSSLRVVPTGAGLVIGGGF